MADSAFGGTNGTRNRRAYDCAALTPLRDELKRGNGWVPGSRRYGQRDAFFLTEAEWVAQRPHCFRKAGLPADSSAVAAFLTTRMWAPPLTAFSPRSRPMPTSLWRSRVGTSRPIPLRR
jgi:hypothetical protein